MMRHIYLTNEVLRSKILQREITFGGNIVLKIYGKLSCRSGKRMKKENRVFFHHEVEAIQAGFRPCGHCMPDAYQQWKLSKKQVEKRG
ncbi:MAG TPA: Ada metal-binding domain-containing protein [Ohtaekwangia sp.]|uniref:Ada metal-binding domain-containing protein n=1 Tax=Ohtaekwangia sp. TaxID=2066019 RepID=UPI002F92E30B